MSDLPPTVPGNPHASPYMPDATATLDGRALAETNLALAYEQRTANLIAYLDWLTKHELGGGEPIDWAIRERLGLEADQ